MGPPKENISALLLFLSRTPTLCHGMRIIMSWKRVTEHLICCFTLNGYKSPLPSPHYNYLTSCPTCDFLFSHLATLSICYMIMTRYHTCAVPLQPRDKTQLVGMRKKFPSRSQKDWGWRASLDTIMVGKWQCLIFLPPSSNGGVSHSPILDSVVSLGSHTWVRILIPLKSVPPILILYWVPNPYFQ